MKVIVILLLTANLTVEELRFQTHGLDCFQLGNAWREANTTYHGARNTDPKQQGNYTDNNELLLGYYCK